VGDDYKPVFESESDDLYKFFLNIGPLKNANGPKYFNGTGVWGQTLQHDTYDSFWQARNIRPHLKNIKPAVLVVAVGLMRKICLVHCELMRLLKNKHRVTITTS